MRNKTPNAICLLVAVAFISIILGCKLFDLNRFIKSEPSGSPKNSLADTIIGKWEIQSVTQKVRISFNKDNTYSEDEDNGASETGTFAVTDAETVILQSPVDGKVTEKIVITNDSMSLTNSDGTTLYGKRIN